MNEPLLMKTQAFGLHFIHTILIHAPIPTLKIQTMLMKHQIGPVAGLRSLMMLTT